MFHSPRLCRIIIVLITFGTRAPLTWIKMNC